MKNVKWGEFKIEDVLQWQSQKEIDPLKLEELKDDTESMYPFYGQATINNGIISYHQLTNKVLNNKNGKPTILIHSNNQNIVYLETPFYLKDGHGATSVLQSERLNKFNQKFIIASIDKVIKSKYSYNKKATKIELKNTIITLPTKNSEIDFEFMESFIVELEAERIAELAAYLSATGLKDYSLTAKEKKVLQDFEQGNIKFSEFTYKSIFNKIVQGRRLKKDDQIPGNIPFVMAGITNTGVVNYISNPVASFPGNSITIDIFGNTFYRGYDFGAGDDTGVYWNDEKKYSKETMLFFAASMEKSISRRFSFGKKLRSSQSLNFKMKLPSINQQPNYLIMETLISAIQKLVIKDVVLYANKK
ncbi:restriction endonuclease subunit S [Brevibacillus laterosporus]|nr:restriction endonuclease subunit S [Brevibacillus laterosporus]MED1789226.1 restriction endonuclease subunit S [Brevibacillus laterosporus]WNX31769.1 restriction endonuclease subunit S [Brevibacillus laterosporus]